MPIQTNRPAPPVPVKAIQGSYLPGNTRPARPSSSRLLSMAELVVTNDVAINLLAEGLNTGVYNPDTPDRYSALGTPVYGSITFGEGDADGRNTFTDAQGKEGFYRTVTIDCAIAEIGFNPSVVLTKIQGLNQTIKEYISSGDSDVTITGIFNSTPGVAPLDFIINMNAMLNAPVPIPVTNYYLNSNNIYYICIQPGTRLGQVAGEYATQRFTIQAISDVPMTDMLP